LRIDAREWGLSNRADVSRPFAAKTIHRVLFCPPFSVHKESYMLRRFLASFLAVTAAAFLPFAAPSAAQAADQTTGVSIPISTASAQGTFTGMLRITSFGVQNNVLVASGTVTGTVVGVGGAASSVVRTVTIPVNTGSTAKVASAKALSCDILHLELGPLDLDLLGLVVHLDRIVLDLSAAPGAGNLLGNLLCSVTNLLNTAGSLAQIANLLNQILGLLG
jgi:hypothetical protein